MEITMLTDDLSSGIHCPAKQEARRILKTRWRACKGANTCSNV